MKIEKERNSTRISYLSKASAGEVSEAFETVCSKVEGIYLPSDVQKEKDGVIINIRHRESLKVYLEKNVFKISVRSSRNVNAAQFCAQFGGGGHAEAAGCQLSGTLEEVKATLRAAVNEVL